MTPDCPHIALVVWTAEGEPIAVRCAACDAPISIGALLLGCGPVEEVTEP